MGMDAIHTDVVDEIETSGERSDVEEIRRAILERLGALLQLIGVVLYGRKVDRSAREPRPLKFAKRIALHDERTDARRVSEDLIERQRHEFRRGATKTQRVAWGECGRV